MFRKLLVVILSISLIICSSFSAFADDTEDGSDVVNDTPVVVVDNTLSDKIDNLITTLTETQTASEVVVEPAQTTMQVLRISANQTSGLHSILLSLIGDYNPIVKDYVYNNTSGYQSHSIEIQPDWSWIMTAALFIVMIYCVFRLFGLALGGVR